MNLDELAALAKQARAAQTRYFRDRSPQNLNYARDWERKLDAAVEAVLNPQAPGLLDEPIKEAP